MSEDNISDYHEAISVDLIYNPNDDESVYTVKCDICEDIPKKPV